MEPIGDSDDDDNQDNDNDNADFKSSQSQFRFADLGTVLIRITLAFLSFGTGTLSSSMFRKKTEKSTSFETKTCFTMFG